MIAMLRPWFALGIVVSLVSVISAQDATPPVPVISAKIGPGGSEAENAVYVIEMRVLEGTRQSRDGSAQRNAVDHSRGAKADTVDRRPTAPPSPPNLPLPQPDAATRATRSAKAVENSGDDDLWVNSFKEPGVAVLAAPRITVAAKEPATIQIQTQQVFSYLVPLGNGKFEVKHSAQHELGMKFTLEVQPVEGDEEFVDVAPLEIHVSALDGREPVEGLNLDVGKPIVATRSLKTTATMKLGATREIAIPSGPKTQAVLLLRVNRRELPEEK